MTGARVGDSGTGRRRYAAVVEKGENAWKREWGSFISGMTLKRLQDGYGAVALKSSADLGHDDDGDGAAGATFSYLFTSPTERKAAREAKQAEARAKARRGESAPLSKHQRALLEAQRRGLKLDNMTRKAKREFLHLTVNKAQEAATQRAREFKLHALMDPALAWYQQGPHPVDLIAEKLVTRKAEKKGKQAQLHYNYLLPHPSWLCQRARRRRESVLVGLGRRFVFDEDGQARDALHHTAVDLRHANLLLTDAPREPCGTSAVAAETSTHEAAAPVTSMDALLVDPRRARLSFTRAVVKDEAAALAIQQANLTTNYLSTSLLHGPGLDESEDETDIARGAAPHAGRKRATVVTRATRKGAGVTTRKA